MMYFKMAGLDEPLTSFNARIAATIICKYVGLFDFGLTEPGALGAFGFFGAAFFAGAGA